MVSKVDSKAKGSGSKGLSWVEGVHDGGFLARFDGPVVWDGGEVLDVEVEVHGVAERGIDSVQDKVLVSVIGEANQKLDKFASGEFCNGNNNNNEKIPDRKSNCLTRKGKSWIHKNNLKSPK